jgi:hypothetical protein
MSLYFDPILNMPREGSRGIAVINNADGTATINFTDPEVRGEGTYELWINGSSFESAAYDASPTFTYTANSQNAISFQVRYYDSVPTELWSSSIVSKVISGDTEATALVAALTTDGFTFTTSKPAVAIQNLFADCRADGILSLLGEFVLPLMEAATPNRRNWIARGQGTFPGGTITHNPTNIAFTSNGYYHFGTTPVAHGLTSSACGCFVIHNATVVAAANSEDIGCTTVAGTSDLELLTHWDGNMLYSSLGNSGSAGINGIDTSGATAPGIFLSSRTGATTGFIRYYRFSDSTVTAITSTSSLSGGAMPTTPITAGAYNLNTIISRFTNRSYRGYGTHKGMTTTQADDLFTNLHTFLTAWGAG